MMKRIFLARTVLGLIATVFLSACSSLTYHTDGTQIPVEVSGGYKWHLTNTFPLSNGVDQMGRQNQYQALQVITFPIDLFVGWHGKTETTPFKLSLTVHLSDENNKPIANAPIRVEFINGQNITSDENGAASFDFTLEYQWPKGTFTEPVSLEFVKDWNRELAEKGEAVEISPRRIQMYLQCNHGVCHMESADHKPLADFTFHVKRIAHIDEEQKAVYAREVREKEEQEAQAAREEAARQAAEAERIAHLHDNLIKGKLKLKSYAEARTMLMPITTDLTQDILPFIASPMTYKDKVIHVTMEVMQVVDGMGLLLKSYPAPPFPYDGTPIYGVVSPVFMSNPDLIDGEHVVIVGEITGTMSYTTAFGASKTVPSLRIYALSRIDGRGNLR